MSGKEGVQSTHRGRRKSRVGEQLYFYSVRKENTLSYHGALTGLKIFIVIC